MPGLLSTARLMMPVLLLPMLGLRDEQLQAHAFLRDADVAVEVPAEIDVSGEAQANSLVGPAVWVDGPYVQICDDAGVTVAMVHQQLIEIERHGGPYIFEPEMVDCDNPLSNVLGITLRRADREWGEPEAGWPAWTTIPGVISRPGEPSEIEVADIYLEDTSAPVVRHQLLHALGLSGHAESAESVLHERRLDGQRDWGEVERSLRAMRRDEWRPGVVRGCWEE